MFQNIVAEAVPHLPYLLAILAGGLLGNHIVDRQIKLSSVAFIVLAFVFVASFVGQAYGLSHDLRWLLLMSNAICGGSLSFALTAGNVGEHMPARA